MDFLVALRCVSSGLQRGALHSRKVPKCVPGTQRQAGRGSCVQLGAISGTEVHVRAGPGTRAGGA